MTRTPSRTEESESTTAKPAAPKSFPFLLQRKCACGGTPGADGECEECRRTRAGLQRRAADSTAPGSIPPIVHDVLRSPGEPLDRATRGFMESRFGHDFSRVRVHLDSRAAQSAAAVAAHAYTVGSHVVFGSGRYSPGSDRGDRLLAHELAHVLQQPAGPVVPSVDGLGLSDNPRHEAEADSVADAALRGSTRPTASSHELAVQRQQSPPTDLGGFTQAERRQLRQSTIPVDMLTAEFLMTVFGTAEQNQGATTSYSMGARSSFDPSIPSALHRGLTSTGAYLATRTNVLPEHSTVTVVLDLTPFQGPHARFRYSRLTRGSGDSASEVLLIENVGPAPATPAAVQAQQGAFQVRGRDFILGPGWSDERFGRLQSVLAGMPDAVLDEAAGLTFSLRGQGTADEAGTYNAERDEIEMHRNAFPASSGTFGASDPGMRNVAHEIGHAIDLRRLERAWQTFNQGGQTAAGRRTLLAERSLSGTRWERDADTGDFSQTEARTTTRGIDFRAAATRDGIRPGAGAGDPLTGGPTDYSNTDWQELYAESFAAYVTDPDLFRLIRPNLFEYFRRRYPLPPAGRQQAPAGGGATHE